MGAEGIDVYCVVEGLDPVIPSKYCRKHFVMPDCTQRIASIAMFLAKFRGEVVAHAVVFPTDDAGTMNLSRLQEEMCDEYVFVAPSRDITQKPGLKKAFTESLDQGNIPHPRHVIPEGTCEAGSAVRELGFSSRQRPVLLI